MSDETNGERRGPATQRPRSPRVPVNFHVELAGQTRTGEPFAVQAEAVRVSRGGATLITEAAVEVGAVVSLTAPFGRTLAAEVNGVWTDATDGRQRIGVKLLDPHGWFAE
ncbi:MAG TPA: PilZ domain-containing protein [Pyrinomonadaceae bacterium]|jgi:hypothetical protein